MTKEVPIQKGEIRIPTPEKIMPHDRRVAEALYQAEMKQSYMTPTLETPKR